MRRAFRSSSEGTFGRRSRAPDIGVLAPRPIVQRRDYDGQVAGEAEGTAARTALVLACSGPSTAHRAADVP